MRSEGKVHMSSLVFDLSWLGVRRNGDLGVVGEIGGLENNKDDPRPGAERGARARGKLRAARRISI